MTPSKFNRLLKDLDQLSGWLRGEYRPRGFNGNISLDYEF